MELSVDLLVGIYGSVVPNKGAIYCSAPITSGRRFLTWVRGRDDVIESVDHAIELLPDEHRRWVVEPNVAHAKAVITKLRSETPVPVIDPTAVPHIPAWKQTQWLRFWEKVITRYAFGVVFVDDWQFSFGCSHEFAHAASQGIPTYDETGHPLSATTALALLDDAALAMEMAGGSPDRLRKVQCLLVAMEANTAGEQKPLRSLIAEHI